MTKQLASNNKLPLVVVESTLRYDRTQAERDCQRLSWMRSNRAFFATGACHILAFVVASKLNHPKGQVVAVVPSQGKPGSHVYYHFNDIAFDFNGWTNENDLLAVTRKDYRKAYSDWDYNLVTIKSDIYKFCNQFNSRPPEDFFKCPLKGAGAYAATLGLHQVNSTKHKLSSNVAP